MDGSALTPFRLRVGLAALSLLVLAVSLSSSFEPSLTLMRAGRLAAVLRGDALPQAESYAFWFDRDYAAFLADVKAATPETASIAVLVPKRPDVYVYQASYQLAPRRVVEAKWMDEAAFVATYRTETERGPGGRPIAHGLLWKR